MSDIFYTKLRSMVGLQGLLSLIFGLLIVFWPNRTAAAVTIMVGIAFIAILTTYRCSNLVATTWFGNDHCGCCEDLPILHLVTPSRLSTTSASGHKSYAIILL